MAKRRHELWAEAIRDVSILLLVFAPLDTLFRAGHGTRLDWLIALGVALLGLLLIAIGITIEAAMIFLPWIAFLLGISYMIWQGTKAKKEYLRRKSGDASHTTPAS